MPRGYGYGYYPPQVGTTGLGDVAAIGQGILSGSDYALNQGSQLQRLLIAKEEEDRRKEATKMATRLKAFELSGRYPELADQLPGLLGAEAEGAVNPEAIANAPRYREADKVVSTFAGDRNLENYEAAAANNPYVSERLGRNTRAAAIMAKAMEERETQQANAEYNEEVRRALLDNPGMTENQAHRWVAMNTRSPRVAKVFEQRRYALAPELSPDAAAAAARNTPEALNLRERAISLGRHGIPYEGGLGDVNDAVQAGPEPPQRLSLTGYFGNESAPPMELPTLPQRPAMPGRSTQQQLLDAMKAEAQAKVTDEQRARLKMDQERTGFYGRDVATREKEAATREGELGRRKDKDAETKEQRRRTAEATLKTFEALAVDTAKKAFPGEDQNSLVRRMALAERLRDRLRKVSDLMGTSDKDAGDYEQEIRTEIDRAKGDLAKAIPEARAATDSLWEQFKNKIGLGRGAPGRQPAPMMPSMESTMETAPAPAAAAPQASPAAQKAARDSLVNALYPGRAWTQLSPEEKQAVADRMNGR